MNNAHIRENLTLIPCVPMILGTNTPTYDIGNNDPNTVLPVKNRGEEMCISSRENTLERTLTAYSYKKVKLHPDNWDPG